MTFLFYIIDTKKKEGKYGRYFSDKRVKKILWRRKHSDKA